MAAKRPSAPGPNARQRLAEQRAAAEAARRRNRALLIVGTIVVVLAVVIAGMWLVATRQRTTAAPTAGASATAAASPSGSVDPSSGSAGPSSASPEYVTLLQHVDPAALDAAGTTGIGALPKAIPGGTALTKDGKPRVLYVGAEFCPFCAMTRLSLTVALSRFGTFSGLKPALSSPNEAELSNMPTVTYLDATYTSDYVAFDAYETADRLGQPLQKMSDADRALFLQMSPESLIPAISWGGTTTSGASYDGSFLAGLSDAQLTALLKDTTNPQTKAILGSANLATAQICRLTGGKPGDVCGAAGVKAADALLK